MSFKKLSFLYLVFILFLFFSSPGKYVEHYESIAITQVELNSRLVQKLKTFESTDPNKLRLKNTTFECMGVLDDLKSKYAQFAEDNLIYGDKIRENQFAEKEIRKGSLSLVFKDNNKKYLTTFEEVVGRSIKSQVSSLKSYTLQEFDDVTFFFKETPNGVINSLFEHMKTVYLYNTITELFREKIILPKYEQILLEEAKFIQRFKRLLILGDQFEMTIQSETGQVPYASVNGQEVSLSTSDSVYYNLTYQPTRAGKYSIEVNLDDERLFTGFEVKRPEFRFVMEKSSFDAFVGQKMLISLDTQYFPSRNVKFVSSRAEVERVEDKLYVTPYETGRFQLSMMQGDEILDELILYAHEPDNIQVGLLDIGGEKSSLKNANRLESLNTFWQVVSFRMTLIDTLGAKKSLRSATRFLRNDLREMESKATDGSVLIFDDIKLISKNRGIVKTGMPIVLKK
jgi:hypothetical protein